MSRSGLPRTSRRTGAVRVAIGLSLLLVLGPLAAASTAAGAAPQRIAAAPVNLGTAAGFSVLAGPSIANTGAGTVLALDLGVSGTLAGFPPGTVTGTTHVADAAVDTAQEDRQTAYDAVAAQTGGTAFSGDQAGKIYTPGLYTTAAAVTNTGTITLDAAGDPGARFVFQIGAALSSAASTKVVLTNGALANNVYWQVVGAVSLGANAKWVGTILGAGVVSFGDGASLKGRILTPSTVALANSPITKPIDDLVAPAVTIAGGATRSTNDPTPSISGTTDEPGTPLFTVTVGSQTLTGRASAGVWALSADTLAAGPHTVVASVADPSGNVGTATQTLTLDPLAPGLTIDGGPTRATSDVTPTISGHTDEPGGPTVTVAVAGQTLATTADAGGAWSVDAGALGESSHSVVASVDDAAGNTGTASQVLTVDVTVPVLTINGGATRSTSDTSPWIYGTTAEQAGTTVLVSLGGQSLTATVKPGGNWGVSAETLALGTYTVLAAITDAAGNEGTMTQVLQIGTGHVDPAVTIDGGATRSTNDTTPTISGTSNAPSGTAVAVIVAGQTLSSTVSPGGVWSVVANTLSEAEWAVTVLVTTGGNTVSATQSLAIDVTPPVLSINAGPIRFTADSTPWTHGTTTEPSGTPVRLTVGGQSLTTTVQPGGAWSVGADTLADGTYTVVASITDAAGNTGTDTQSLQVGGVFTNPAVTIDGGATADTDDATPTLSGASDAPAATVVRVAVAGQDLATTVGADGLWSVTAATLSEGPHALVASVTVGGATGTATQTLSVDVTTPVLTIAGGPARSTSDTTPRVTGVSTEPAGTSVRVTVTGQVLTATVDSGGAWGVGTDTLALGVHTVAASITDAAGNTVSATQVLTIEGATPPVPPTARYRPDAEVRKVPGSFVGKGRYASGQQVTAGIKGRARQTTFQVRVTNRGNVPERMAVVGTRTNAKLAVVYLYGRTNVTSAVVAGTYRTPALGAGRSTLLTMKVTRRKGAAAGSMRTFQVRVASTHVGAVRDTVGAVVKVAR